MANTANAHEHVRGKSFSSGEMLFSLSLINYHFISCPIFLNKKTQHFTLKKSREKYTPTILSICGSNIKKQNMVTHTKRVQKNKTIRFIKQADRTFIWKHLFFPFFTSFPQYP